MIEHGQISGLQLFYLLVGGIVSTAALVLPGLMAAFAGPDAWLSGVLGAPLGLVIAAVFIDLQRRFPGQTVIQYSRTLLGPWGGRLTGLVLLLTVLMVTSASARQFIGFAAGPSLPRTPIWVTGALLAVPVVYAVRAGLEVVARAAELLMPFGLAGLLVLILFALPEMNAALLLPVLAKGAVPVLRGAAAPAGWYAEFMLLGFLLPYYARRRPWPPALAALAATMALLLLTTVAAIAVLGPATADFVNPIFQLARIVSIGEFITHLDPLVVVFALAWGFVKDGVWLYVLSLGAAQWLGLRDYRPLTLPMSALVFVMSVASWESTSHLQVWIARDWPFVALVGEVLPAACLWAAARLRHATADAV